MFSTILSGTVYGIQSHMVHVEVDLSSGLPCFVMVGSLGAEVREAAERIRVALKNSGIQLPPMHIAVNLSPASVHKEGTGFDLPIAVGVLTAMGVLPPDRTQGILFLGELGLNGELKPVRGVLPIAVQAVRQGIDRCLIPVENLGEAGAVKEMQAKGAENLLQVIEYLRADPVMQKEILPSKQENAADLLQKTSKEVQPDFQDIAGQETVKRAALISAAGFHHMLITGPPGAGKTMIARRLSTILPPLSLEECMEVSSLYSIAGRLPEGQPLVTERPFLSPHHTISPQALSGGGRIPHPGIVSLAHRGVLFLDELPEFKRQTLDLLRQPLEDREIHIARSSGSFTYPAEFMLVAAMNPCPCGYYPDRNKCACTPYEVHRYLSHISGPILDRIDLGVWAFRVDIRQLQSKKKGISSRQLKDQVLQARAMQQERYRGTGIRFNSELMPGDMESFCPLEQEEKNFLEQLFCTLNLSARAYHRLLKVARTIADLEGSDRIKVNHLTEAVCYRAEESVYGKEE